MKILTIPKLLIFFWVTTLTFTANGQIVKTIYHYNFPEFYSENEDVKKSVATIAELIGENGAVLSRLQSVEPAKRIFHTWGTEKNIRVLEDRIEFTKKDETATIYFKDIINNFSSGDYYGNITIYTGDYGIRVKGKETSQNLRDELLSLREKTKILLIEDRKSQLEMFEKTAAEYRALKVKPPLSEEQRKYIVQANAYNEKKMYNDAIESYNQAIRLDQTAYPSAYFNLALLSAHIKQYNEAIFYMKKYLLLEPDANDARGARDKIYEWEVQIEN